MKKIILMASLAMFSLNSFAEFSMTCTEMYNRTLVSKEISKHKVDKVAYNMQGAGTILSFGGLPIIGVSIIAGASALAVYANSASKEERIMRLTEEGNQQLLKLTSKFQKKINSNITSEEVLGLIKDGLVSGLFCSNFPKLYSPKEVKESIEDQLKIKYSSAQ